MRKPDIWGAMHHTQDMTLLSQFVGADDGKKLETVQADRLVTPAFREEHKRTCTAMIEEGFRKGGRPA